VNPKHPRGLPMTLGNATACDQSAGRDRDRAVAIDAGELIGCPGGVDNHFRATVRRSPFPYWRGCTNDGGD
jgi:hypothetical protein